MQFNKKDLNKVNEKKTLKKVKKNWVVASVSSFIFMGAASFTLMTNHISAYADEGTAKSVVVTSAQDASTQFSPSASASASDQTMVEKSASTADNTKDSVASKLEVTDQTNQHSRKKRAVDTKNGRIDTSMTFYTNSDNKFGSRLKKADGSDLRVGVNLNPNDVHDYVANIAGVLKDTNYELAPGALPEESLNSAQRDYQIHVVEKQKDNRVNDVKTVPVSFTSQGKAVLDSNNQPYTGLAVIDKNGNPRLVDEGNLESSNYHISDNAKLIMDGNHAYTMEVLSNNVGKTLSAMFVDREGKLHGKGTIVLDKEGKSKLVDNGDLDTQAYHVVDGNVINNHGEYQVLVDANVLNVIKSITFMDAQNKRLATGKVVVINNGAPMITDFGDLNTDNYYVSSTVRTNQSGTLEVTVSAKPEVADSLAAKNSESAAAVIAKSKADMAASVAKAIEDAKSAANSVTSSLFDFHITSTSKKVRLLANSASAAIKALQESAASDSLAASAQIASLQESAARAASEAAGQISGVTGNIDKVTTSLQASAQTESKAAADRISYLLASAASYAKETADKINGLTGYTDNLAKSLQASAEATLEANKAIISQQAAALQASASEMIQRNSQAAAEQIAALQASAAKDSAAAGNQVNSMSDYIKQLTASLQATVAKDAETASLQAASLMDSARDVIFSVQASAKQTSEAAAAELASLQASAASEAALAQELASAQLASLQASAAAEHSHAGTQVNSMNDYIKELTASLQATVAQGVQTASAQAASLMASAADTISSVKGSAKRTSQAAVEEIASLQASAAHAVSEANAVASTQVASLQASAQQAASEAEVAILDVQQSANDAEKSMQAVNDAQADTFRHLQLSAATQIRDIQQSAAVASEAAAQRIDELQTSAQQAASEAEIAILDVQQSANDAEKSMQAVNDTQADTFRHLQLSAATQIRDIQQSAAAASQAAAQHIDELKASVAQASQVTQSLSDSANVQINVLNHQVVQMSKAVVDTAQSAQDRSSQQIASLQASAAEHIKSLEDNATAASLQAQAMMEELASSLQASAANESFIQTDALNDIQPDIQVALDSYAAEVASLRSQAVADSLAQARRLDSALASQQASLQGEMDAMKASLQASAASEQALAKQEREQLQNELQSANDQLDQTKVSLNFYPVTQKNKVYVVKNTKGVWIHSSAAFTNKNQKKLISYGSHIKVQKVVQYGKTTRLYMGPGRYVTANRKFVATLSETSKYPTYVYRIAKNNGGRGKTFKVQNVRYVRNKQLQYKIGKKYVNASGYDEAYYRDQSPIKKYRVIRKGGGWVHKKAKYTKKTKVRKLKRGKIIKVKKIVKTGKVTRLYIGKGQYFTANKTYVVRVYK
ncbi:DUF5776 domain-containing protein [Apilactobacillus bombintestini]|uniref:DUF5776 domain-containing protein n=1 Tax=Apilactobacillus bombintestini TaxID=2419772 RepID=A0A387AQF5_9LACO|nr:DUF5776 domain-containing protein [Apilactobacillus bombintestini]AYF93002.1 hypothetical protein D7I45_05790 [Apilactobacillus bombintestini]